MTTQRRVILKVLKNTDIHPTADWVYQEVRKELPKVSLGTIYRNLGTLAEAGEILELNYSNSQSRYDGNPNPHYHFRCQSCGRVYDLPLPYRPEMDKEASSTCQHKITGHRLEFYGICHYCRRANSEKSQ
ncbi:MAG: transcriptional repressor [Firmicutes bacterium]|nr:transcriptional repressor [Bacillota bacterium]